MSHKQVRRVATRDQIFEMTYYICRFKPPKERHALKHTLHSMEPKKDLENSNLIFFTKCGELLPGFGQHLARSM